MLLEEKIHGMRAINTHSHHQRDDFFADMSLDKLLENSYVSWCGLSPGEDSASRQAYLDRVRHKSYFVYLMKAVKRLYEIDEDLEPYTWDMYSRAIREANADPAWHKAVLSVMCGYEKVIVDAYWDPGSCNDDRLFTAAFRIDALMFGYSKDAANHNGNSPYALYGEEYDNLDSYMRFVDQLIRKKAEGGCVALKCALAYDRPIDFDKTSRSSAEKAFGSPTPKNVRSFQNYLFHEICSLAAEMDVPMQCHTGMGQMRGTHAMNLLDAIEQHPGTKFVLFHGGFPWTDETAALLHYLPNVYVDICWLPLLSPTAAESALHKFIEIGTSDKICWGCDTWTSEESAGARMAMDHVLGNVLSAKIESGHISQADHGRVAEDILANNAKALYKL